MSKIQRFNVYSFHSRLLSIMILIGLGFLILIGRIFYLQIWNQEYYFEQARQRQQRTINLEGKRHSIFDNRKKLLATSIKVDSIHALPSKVKSPRKVARQLAPLLAVNEERLYKKLISKRSFVWLKRQINPSLSSKIKKLNINGIDFIREFRRFYPFGNFAGPLLGFTGIDSQGLEGLEYEYQNLLQEKSLRYVVEQDGKHRIIPSIDSKNTQKKNYYSLNLTINSSIQYFSEKALKRGLSKVKGKRGIAIVMESQTGAILAIANSPDFDPNNFQSFPQSRYLNYAVTTGFEPGSTIKPLTIAIALEENLLNADDSFFCEEGAYKIGKVTITDLHPEGWLTVGEIIQKSSNICAGKIGSLITKETHFDYLQQFGFGSKTNIGLSAEASGHLPIPKKWNTIDHAYISFGYGLLVSRLQLLVALNTIATGGLLVRPFIISHLENEQGDIVKELKARNGKIIQQFGPKDQKRILSVRTSEMVKQFMISVTQKEGTAPLASIPGVTVAGKTGTSEILNQKTKQYSKKENYASFFGFVPAEKPVLSILVVVDSPKVSRFGGAVSAPIFKEIAERSLIFLGIF